MSADKAPASPPEFAKDKGSPIYKFRAFDNERDPNPEWQGYAASLLRDDLIYCASPRELNDPWEGMPAFAIPDVERDPKEAEKFIEAFAETVREGSMSPAEVAAHVSKIGYAEVCRSMQRIHARNMWDRGVYCVAGNCTEPLLWSYYSSGHSGYCWIFDSTKSPLSAAVKVSYVARYPEIDWSRWKEQDVTRLSLLTKADFWRHEDEYRLLLPTPTKESPQLQVVPHNGSFPERKGFGRYLKLPSDALLGVVFGITMRPEHKAVLIRLAREFKATIEFLQAGIHLRDYKVEIKTLPPHELAAIEARAPA